MKTKLSLLVALITFTCHAQATSPGDLDLNFGTFGTASSDPQIALYPYCVESQLYTGELLVGGTFKPTNTTLAGFVARYDFYGHPVAGFGTNGILILNHLSATSHQVYRVHALGAGAGAPFIVKGSYKNASNQTIPYFSKYLANGTLDTSYGTGGTIEGITGQIEGDFIYSVTYNSTTQHQTFKRYVLATGALDPTFNNGDLPFLASDVSYNLDSQYNTITFQANGSILLGGRTRIAGIDYPFVGRYDANGNLDASFGTGGYYTDMSSPGQTVWKMVSQTDNAIVILYDGSFNAGNAKVLHRITGGGAPDTSYGTSGYHYEYYAFDNNWVDDIKIQADNAVLLTGAEGMGPGGSPAEVLFERVGTNGITDFWRTDLSSDYSENWDLTKVGETYAVTFGVTTASNIWTGRMQRLYLKPPVISLIGSALAGTDSNTDVNLTTTDGTNYSIQGVQLNGNNDWLKLRLDHDWSYNWGATATTNPFPSGQTGMGSNDIHVTTPGFYNVNFNIRTGQITFELVSISLIGSNIGTPWTSDLDLNSTDGFNYTLNNYTLGAGEAKFRQNHTWMPAQPDWGSTAFPSGTGTLSGQNIPITAGTYNISFNRMTYNYLFDLVLGTPDFNVRSIKVTPNPVTDVLQITANRSIESAKVYDLNGRKVLEQQSENISNINVGSLAKGVYLLQLQSGDEISTQKIIKN